MLVAGLDLETTGLSVDNDVIVEVGCVMWDTDTNRADYSFSYCLKREVTAEQYQMMAQVSHITPAHIARGQDAKAILKLVAQTMKNADFMMAHNGNMFDKPMLVNDAARLGVELPEKFWIDSTCDIEYPEQIKTRKLIHLAAEHGFVNPFPHQAAADVSTMLQVAARYNWEQIFKWAKSPVLTVKAETNFSQKELAKKQNYYWNGEAKEWTKTIKEFQLEDVKKAALEAGFKITVRKAT
jgi:DNA polymerase-3 subunit epsilon